jgi:hypothetical protein
VRVSLEVAFTYGRRLALQQRGRGQRDKGDEVLTRARPAAVRRCGSDEDRRQLELGVRVEESVRELGRGQKVWVKLGVKLSLL